MIRNILNINAQIVDPQNKFADNVAKSGGKVTFTPADNLLSIEFPPAPAPADMTTLLGGFPSNIKAKRNNKNGNYSINFNLTAAALRSFGKKSLLNELKQCFDAIWNDLDSTVA